MCDVWGYRSGVSEDLLGLKRLVEWLPTFRKIVFPSFSASGSPCLPSDTPSLPTRPKSLCLCRFVKDKFQMWRKVSVIGLVFRNLIIGFLKELAKNICRQSVYCRQSVCCRQSVYCRHSFPLFLTLLCLCQLIMATLMVMIIDIGHLDGYVNW
jgi:hypothetical protein